MDIYLLDGMAFVNFGKGYMICIGTKREVDEASPERLMQMVREAVIYCQYRSIETAKDQTKH